MKYQILTTYYQLSLEGRVEPIKCFNTDHPSLVPHSTEDGAGMFMCMLCGYKVTPGMNLYYDLYKKVEGALDGRS